MGTVRGRVAPDQSAVPRLITGFGLALLVAFFIETAAFSGLDPQKFLSWQVILGFSTFLPFAGGIVYGGHWLRHGTVEPERYVRAAKWCGAGAMAFLGINLVLIVAFPPDTVWMLVGWMRATATWGAAGGLLAGIIEARAIQHALDAEREEMRASYLETQQEAIEYLNGLLRHEVLNTAQVISGYTTVLLDTEDLADERRDQLETIRRQSQDMTAVVEDIRLLIEAMRDEATLHPVDLSRVLREELQDVQDRTQVTVEADVPDNAVVRADGFLPRVFGNLFTNAVEHNDSSDPTLDVTLETTDERAVVTVADDGPGIAPDLQDELFERDDLTHSEYGLGLVLVGRLVARYDGDVDLATTGPEGSTFVVELPLAEAEAVEDTVGQSSPSRQSVHVPEAVTGADQEPPGGQQAVSDGGNL